MWLSEAMHWVQEERMVEQRGGRFSVQQNQIAPTLQPPSDRKIRTGVHECTIYLTGTDPYFS